MPGLGRFFDPQVERHLIADQGEIIVDEVRRHPMAILRPVLGLFGCIALFVSMPYLGRAWWVTCVLGLALFGYCLWRIHSEHMDRFVITNMRVFRVHGVFSQHTATMPMQRILDIAVHKPFIGRIFNYGHFIFESAAQDQGLRDIRYVGRPDERDLTIQRVIQRSGARKSFSNVGGEGW
ncbi:membrane-flanked domain protein [Enemella dayhoffiae]|uniref:Membrane-flanked domain protein n=1 Tax=Enemella dayhoffiae TaxID=2016507 RepID=A0A255GWU7_9ACTN|nr:membrane-flanked domain protein [Enemella dayhoffiae]